MASLSYNGSESIVELFQCTQSELKLIKQLKSFDFHMTGFLNGPNLATNLVIPSSESTKVMILLPKSNIVSIELPSSSAIGEPDIMVPLEIYDFKPLLIYNFIKFSYAVLVLPENASQILVDLHDGDSINNFALCSNDVYLQSKYCIYKLSVET